MKPTTLVLALLACACRFEPVEPQGDQTAAAICQALARLQCDEALPTPNGTPCTRVFADVAESGVDLESSRLCIEQATSCDAARHC